MSVACTVLVKLEFMVVLEHRGVGDDRPHQGQDLRGPGRDQEAEQQVGENVFQVAGVDVSLESCQAHWRQD